MKQVYEVEVDERGAIHLLESIPTTARGRALLVFLPEVSRNIDDALISERALATEWLTEEEDAAWAHLQKKT